jgi:hypothetical protein
MGAPWFMVAGGARPSPPRPLLAFARTGMRGTSVRMHEEEEPAHELRRGVAEEPQKLLSETGGLAGFDHQAPASVAGPSLTQRKGMLVGAYGPHALVMRCCRQLLKGWGQEVG